ncbi:MAG: NADH-quinone oxidoreductase subunit C [Desulfobacterales bacterium]|nr:NADH-quinone oxidoreductase subunit C [Desulfobacterales bacterium]
MQSLDITKETLRQEGERLKAEGWRFVTITCLELDETTLEMIYHFDKDLEIIHYRMQIPKAEPTPSLSPVFFAAFLVENEIYDQFGIKFDELVLDFGGTLYLDDNDDITATPFCKFGVKKADTSADAK